MQDFPLPQVASFASFFSKSNSNKRSTVNSSSVNSCGKWPIKYVLLRSALLLPPQICHLLLGKSILPIYSQRMLCLYEYLQI